MKINKLLESKKIKESVEPEVLWRNRNRSIIKDGYGFGIDNGVTVNRFHINNDGKVVYDYEPPNTIKTTIDRLIRQGKFNNPHYSENPKYVGNTLKYGRGVEESFEKDGGPFWYFTRHGLGPGMLPKGVNVVDTKEDDNFGTYIALDKVLTTQELKEYELVEKKPSMEEAFKPSDSGIQSVKCYNRYNYTIQELRVDNDNKTFERGNFTAGKADKKTQNRQEYEDIVDSLKKLGYTEIKSDYRSLRNKTRKGIPTQESWTDDHQDIMARKTSGYDKCYKIVKKARTSNPVDTNALNDARDHFGYDLYKMCLDDVLKELNESGQDTVTRYQVEYFIDENDDSDTPLETYVYTDSKREAIAKVKAEYPNAQIVYCVSETVPASYKEWDMKEGYEFNPNNADISWRPYDNEKGQVMADKWYESKWPDDEVGIEQLKGITLDDALKDRSILGHCDTQVRERVYAQLDKYIPLSVDSPMYKKKNESKSIDKYSKSHTPKMEGYFSDDDVEDDIEHANLYGGDTMYCRDCGTKKKWDDGYSYCPKCNDIDLDESKESEESELITQYLNNGEFDKLEKIHNGTNVVWKLKEPVNETFDDDVDDLSYYYSEEDIIDALNDVWEEISSKQVADSDGFMTDYTMYRNINTGEYVFVFGDKDIYRPEDGYFDWECETKEEAEEWFDNYHGFDDSDDDIDWMNEEISEEESPIVHTKPDGTYLVKASSGDGYTAFNKSNVCAGHISATNDNEAKSKFNSNQFDEEFKNK